jgi:two-component system sensor histidine kinase UhpB
MQKILNYITSSLFTKKSTEHKIHKAIERYEILAKATSDTIWDWDISNNQMQYNYGITNMFGYEVEEINNLSDWWEQKIHPDDLERVKDFIGETIKQKNQHFQLEYRFRCNNGAYKFIYDRAFVLFDESANPIRIIGAMQDITNQKEEEIRVAKEVINAQELERQHIGSELHDNVNQILVGAMISLDMVKLKMDDKEKAVSLIDKTKTYIDHAITEIRKLSHELAPDVFENNTLKQSVENLINSINVNNQFSVTLNIQDSDIANMKNEIQQNLYRILQEQLKNILKHAMASKIEIDLTVHNNIVTLRICDNGKGFDTSSTRLNGIGLRNIKRRAELLNGTFKLNSAVNNGCVVIVSIPLPASA